MAWGKLAGPAPDIQRTARAGGAFVAGVADLSDDRVRECLEQWGSAWLTCFPRGVSLAFRLQDPVVDRLPGHHREPDTAGVYQHHVYEVVNRQLDSLASRMAAHLQGQGHASLAIPASLELDPQRHLGSISHKLVAHLAGLGWIGRSSLLVTSRAGPRIRLATVLTDAPLPASEPVDPGCSACRECVDACPADAFSGRAFDPMAPLALRMDVEACDSYRVWVQLESGVQVCGVCVAVCPRGRPGSVRDI